MNITEVEWMEFEDRKTMGWWEVIFYGGSKIHQRGKFLLKDLPAVLSWQNTHVVDKKKKSWFTMY